MEIDFINNDEEIVKKIIEKLSITFEYIINDNNKKKDKDNYFYNNTVPNITINKYLIRINKYIIPSYTLYIILPYILDNIMLKEEYNIKINKNNIHYILITSFLLISKYYEDNVYNNKYYADIGGLTLEKLNKYEILLLEILDYDLGIEEEIYNQYKFNILN